MLDDMIKSIISDYGPEWVLLEKCAGGLRNEDDKEVFKTIVKEYKLNYGKLIEQAIVHKILPMLVLQLMKNQLLLEIPPVFQQYFRFMLDINKRRTELLREQVVRITEALNKKNIKFVCTKGIVLESTLYNSEGYRFMSDIDFLVEAKDQKEVLNTLQSLGYEMGFYNLSTDETIKLSREEYLVYAVTKNKIPVHFIKLNDPVIPCLYVGFDLDFTWSDSLYKIPLEDCLKDIAYIDIPGYECIKIPTLNSSYHFIYIILHLIKHAWSESLRKSYADTTVMQFSDVLNYWNTEKNTLKSDLRNVLDRYDLEKPILWVLEHVDYLFKSNIIKELDMEGKVSQEWLNSSIVKGNKIVKWEGTIRDRLCNRLT